MVVAGVDIGGTKIAAGLVDPDGQLLAEAVVPTPSSDGPRAVLDAAEAAVGQLGTPVRAAGVGSAGVVDPVTGLVRSATDTLAGWAGTDLRAELRARLGVPVAVDNDVHAHALGEVWKGAGSGHRTVLFVAVGTGVGGSIVLDGQVHHGRSAVAGHLGHVPVPGAAGRSCTCGGEDHVEAVARGPALLAEYRRRSGTTGGDLPDVADLAERGDDAAAAVLAEGARALGEGIGGLMNVIDPDVVLFSGGVSACGDAWWAPLRAAIGRQLLPPLREVPLLPGELGGDAALLGAAKLGWEALA